MLCLEIHLGGEHRRFGSAHIGAMPGNIVQSLRTRIALLAEEAEENDSNSPAFSRMPPRTRLHAWQLPRRVFIRVGRRGGGDLYASVCVCMYKPVQLRLLSLSCGDF